MTIPELKTHLRLSVVLSHYGLVPDKHGRLRCPWHADKTPSLQVYLKTDSWTCFSSKCEAGSGDQLDFIMKYEGISKHEALKKAETLVSDSLIHLPVPTHTKQSLITKMGLTRMGLIIKLYQSSQHAISRSSKAKAYAESRKLDIASLQLGYLGYDPFKSWSAEEKAQAESYGLTHLKNSLIFPLKDQEGKLISVYGRAITQKARHAYLKGPHQGLYPAWPAPTTKTLILTESVIDAATLQQYTDYPSLALYGTNGFTPSHEAALSSLPELEELILFFDGDEAGRAAVSRYQEKLRAMLPDVRISSVDTPEGEDSNSLACHSIAQEDISKLTHLIEQRVVLSTEKEQPIPAENLQLKSEPPSTGDQGLPGQAMYGKLITQNAEHLIYQIEDLKIELLGGIRLRGLDKLKVTVKITSANTDYLPIRHSLDLYHSREVEQLARKLAEELERGSQAAKRILNHLTTALETYRAEQQSKQTAPKATKLLSPQAKEAALTFLKQPKLLRRTLEALQGSGITGERDNSLIAYLIYTSRKRDKPLHVLFLGSSGSGKTWLQEKVSALIPETDKIEITSLSDNALYYFGKGELANKLLLIEDLDGAEQVLYPLRELQSKQRISRTVTLKDPQGRLKTLNQTVKGPVSISGCTTREKIYEDNANRSILLYIDESSQQDSRIMAYQQAQSAGEINTEKEEALQSQLRAVQQVLKPYKILNPYAGLITLPPSVFKPRRTLVLLLSFIETLTLYHQYQRDIQTNPDTGECHLESTPEDIAAGFHLMKEVLFRKSDELSKASRSFLERLKQQVKEGDTFSSQHIRKAFRMAPSSLKRYLSDLHRHGYLSIKGGSKYRGYEYQIVDYGEYQSLKSQIDSKLEEILEKVKIAHKARKVAQKSGPVAQEWPSEKSGPLNGQTLSNLAAK